MSEIDRRESVNFRTNLEHIINFTEVHRISINHNSSDILLSGTGTTIVVESRLAKTYREGRAHYDTKSLFPRVLHTGEGYSPKSRGN